MARTAEPESAEPRPTNVARHSFSSSPRRLLSELAAAASVVLIVVGLLVLREGRDTDEQRPVSTSQGRIEGTVVAGPVCPVEGAPECDATAKPVQAVIAVFSIAPGRDTADEGTLITRVTTDARGRFGVELPAGAYQLMPRAANPALSTRPHVVHVVAGRTSVVELALDTGIR